MTAPAIDYDYVRRLTLMVSRHLPPHLDRDDLIQEANIAAWQAADRFDESFGVPFDGYLAIRIRGAVTDYVRFWQHSRRTVRATLVSINEPVWAGGEEFGELADNLADDSVPVDDSAAIEIDLRDMHDRVARQLVRLNATTRWVLEEYFMKNRSMKSIGLDLDLTEGRVSQMITRDLQRMRNMPSWQRLAEAA